MGENKKNQKINLNFIKRYLKTYENYFHLLGLPYDESKIEYYTSKNEEEKINEIVKELYKNKLWQLEKMLQSCEKSEELQKIKEEFIVIIQDAYTALKDNNSRENYIDLLKKIQNKNSENWGNHESKGGEKEWEK